MYNSLVRSILSLCFLLLITVSLSAQETSPSRNILVVGAGKTLKISGKITYVVAKEFGKLGWEAAKVTGKEIVAPTLKLIVVKAAPLIASTALKATAGLAKRGLPFAGKLALTYIKF